MPERSKGIIGPMLKLFKLSPVKAVDETDEMDLMRYSTNKDGQGKTQKERSKSPDKKPTLGTGGKEDNKPVQKVVTGDSKRYPKGLFVPIPTTPPEPTYSDKKIAAVYEKKLITMKEVQKHCSRTDAWTVINGVVYDVTNFISQHPGGSTAITKILGKDGSALFGTLDVNQAKQHKTMNADQQLSNKRVGLLHK